MTRDTQTPNPEHLLLILLSPSLGMDFENRSVNPPTDKPVFSAQASKIMAELKKLSQGDLAKLMKTSPEITDKVHRDIKSWSNRVGKKSIAAIDAFAGVVYQGVAAGELNKSQRQAMQKSIRIISGLYGVLKPFDAIQEYRLEMKTTLPVGPHKNLYQFWADSISESLEKEKQYLIIDLTSKEYSRLISREMKNTKVLSVDFKNRRNGLLKNLSYHAKLARGIMARRIITEGINSAADIRKLKINADPHNYVFSKRDSDEQNWIFVAKS